MVSHIHVCNFTFRCWNDFLEVHNLFQRANRWTVTMWLHPMGITTLSSIDLKSQGLNSLLVLGDSLKIHFGFWLPLSLFHSNCTVSAEARSVIISASQLRFLHLFLSSSFPVVKKSHVLFCKYLTIPAYLYQSIHPCLHSLLELGENNGVGEEEQVSLRGLRALGDLDALVEQQLSVLAAEAEDEWTLLHGHPAGRLLPERVDTRERVGDGQGHPTAWPVQLWRLHNVSDGDCMVFNAFEPFCIPSQICIFISLNSQVFLN